mgnify:CR=1 FL=1
MVKIRPKGRADKTGNARVAGVVEVRNEEAMRADRGEDALARLNRLVAQDLQACNTLIIERMQSPVALIPQLAAHIIAPGGKRLRPLLTLAASRLRG